MAARKSNLNRIKMKIKHLKIQTANLETQAEFYGSVLGLPILEKNEHTLSVKIGSSTLEFSQHPTSTPYHLAFHIGGQQEKEALKWLKKRVDILQNEGKDLVDFPAWNAKSLYFYDADRNVVEFISRKYFRPGGEGFSEKAITGIAEIGLSTNTVEEFFRFLNVNFQLEIYFGKPDEFCAIGDENGLLITVDQHRKTWFPTHDPALPADFDLKFERNEKLFELNYERGKLSVM